MCLKCKKLYNHHEYSKYLKQKSLKITINYIKDFNSFSFTESGAIFAFGKSHLTTIPTDDSDNNYFFIKNDPVKKLICGKHQSAVICGKRN